MNSLQMVLISGNTKMVNDYHGCNDIIYWLSSTDYRGIELKKIAKNANNDRIF